MPVPTNKNAKTDVKNADAKATTTNRGAANTRAASTGQLGSGSAGVDKKKESTGKAAGKK
jgi:hypothetical protein